jgi:SAM-dependent MidA family methyltransferase
MTASGARSILPSLSAEERAHSAAVTARIGEELKTAGGWLSFERFMDLALYTPGLGYYSAGSTKIGPAGDYVTAPEVSGLFGRCLARQCAEILRATRGDILELGAGTGALAGGLLTELAARCALPERYAILEVSADLAARQRERLAQLPQALHERVVWLERLPRKPLRGVILANEVADALPFRRVRWSGRGWWEIGVARASSRVNAGDETGTGTVYFQEEARNPDAALASACAEILAALPMPLPGGYTSEVCLLCAPWIASLSGCLERGVLLLTDYGLPRRHYYHPERADGTLRCHFRHRAHDDPFINVGVQDITAWVDFTRVAAAASAAGLKLQGFATQAAFLLALGIEGFVAEAADDMQRTRLAGEARRLMLPEEMGESFKAMALSRDFDAALAGFALQDLRYLL